MEKKWRFLGKKAYQTSSSAMLARKFDAYIILLLFLIKKIINTK